VKPTDSKSKKVAAATNPSLLQKYIPALAGETAPAGPSTLGARRDAWVNALQQMQGVNASTPLVAGAQALGMGLAGYGAGKATQQAEQGQQAFRERMAKALTGGVPSNDTLSSLMSDPYADGASDAIMKLWERANPDPNAIKHNNVTIEYPNGTKIPVDLATPEGQKMYGEFITKMQSGGTGTMPGGGGIKNPFDITKEFNNDKQYQSAQVATATLNSMAKSFKDKSAISDLDFIIGVAKILDPTSVVRTQEGEQVQATQALPSQVAGRLNQLLNGQQQLDDKTRADLYRLAQRRTDELQVQGAQQRDFYGEIAKQNGYDPNTYVPQLPSMPDISVGDTPEDMPQAPAGWQPGQPLPGAPPAASGAPPAPSPQPGATPLPDDPVTPPVEAPAPPLPSVIQGVPNIQRYWPSIVDMSRNEDGSLDEEALQAVIRALQTNPRYLDRLFPQSNQQGGQ